MNVLHSFKERFTSLQNDISVSLKSKIENSTIFTAKQNTDFQVNFYAGAELLERFNQYWAQIHEANEENGQAAKEVVSLASTVCDSLQNKHELLEMVSSSSSTLAEIMRNIETTSRQLDDIHALSCQIEDSLVELESQIEFQEMEENKKHHFSQLSQYQKRQAAELELAKNSMAEKNAMQMDQYELMLQAKIQERQKIFDEDFQKEIRLYKQHRKIEVAPHGVSSFLRSLTAKTPLISLEKSLEEVQLDEDTEALYEFLGSEEHAVSGKLQLGSPEADCSPVPIES